MSTSSKDTGTTAPPPTSDPTLRQLRLFKRLAALLAAALVLGAAAFFYFRLMGQPVTIKVGEKIVGTVANRAAANALITAAEQSKVGAAFAGEEPKRMQKILLVPALPNTPQDPDGVVKGRLLQALTLHVHAYVILVNGHPSIALPTSDIATETLNLVKTRWAQIGPAATVVGQPEILNRIAIEKRAVDTRLTRQDAASAAPYFWSPPPSKTYKVKRGDIGSRVAYRNHVSLSDLITANPNVNVNNLKPGDVLNVQKMPLLLTVRVRKQIVKMEPVDPNVPAAQAGQQRVTYVITYLNGQETRREASDIAILEKPVMHVNL